MNYLPVVLYAVWILYGARTLPSIYDPAVLRDPMNRAWTPSRLIGDAAWTDFGRTVRWRWIKHIAIGASVATVLQLLLIAFLHQA